MLKNSRSPFVKSSRFASGGRLSHDLVIRATRLARISHTDDRLVGLIVHKAALRLETADHTQRKRLYYGDASKRSKTYYPAPALLHMLVLSESDRFERFDERRRPTPLATIGIRYVKHLVWIAARRNSFHVALAVCRLLFHYGTAETMAIYDALLRENDFIKEDYYYRARKRVLMRESEQRFPGLVRAYAARAEERFEPDPDQDSWLEVVLATLEECTPWGTRCSDDPTAIATLEEGDEAELARLHVLIHPPCFETLVARVGLESPRRRLAMPRFRSENATVPEVAVETMAGTGKEAGPTCPQPPV